MTLLSISVLGIFGSSGLHDLFLGIFGSSGLHGLFFGIFGSLGLHDFFFGIFESSGLHDFFFGIFGSLGLHDIFFGIFGSLGLHDPFFGIFGPSGLQDEEASGGGSWKPLILGLMVACPGVAILITIVGWVQLKSFISGHPKIGSRNDLVDMKALAEKHLVLARVIRPLLLAGTPLLILLFILGEFEFMDLAWCIGPSLVSLCIGLAMRPTQTAAETLPVAEDLKYKRDGIVEGWHAGGGLPEV